MKKFIEKLKRLITDPHATVWDLFGKGKQTVQVLPPSTTPQPKAVNKRVLLRRIVKITIPLILLVLACKYTSFDSIAGKYLFWSIFSFVAMVACCIIWAKKGWRMALSIFIGMELLVVGLPWTYDLILEIPWKTVGSWFVYALGLAAVVGLCLLFKNKEGGSSSKSEGEWVLKFGKFLMTAAILGALFCGPLILGGIVTKRNIWNDISGTIAMWALIGLIIPVIAFAFMGKGAKFAAVIVTLMIYSIVGQTIIQKGKEEMQARKRLAGPPPMTARDWRLKVNSEPQGSRHQSYRYYNARVTRWDNEIISLKVSFVTEQGEPSEGFMFWDKRKSPTAGEWYQNYERRGGTWAWTQVGPLQYAGDMIDVRGVPYTIALEAVP